MPVREHAINTLHVFKNCSEDHFNSVAYKIKLIDAKKSRKDTERANIWNNMLDSNPQIPQNEVNQIKSDLVIAFNGYDSSSSSQSLPKIKSLKRYSSKLNPSSNGNLLSQGSLKSTGNIKYSGNFTSSGNSAIGSSKTSGVLPVPRSILRGRKFKDRISNSKSLPSQLPTHLLQGSNQSLSLLSEEPANV